MPERRIATVLMLDVVGSTNVAAQLGDVRYRELSSRFNRLVRAALKRFGGREEDHAGDGFFATFTQPDRAIRCAATLADDVRTLGIEIRSGIHTGQTESQEGKTHGIAVVIGARVMSLANAGEILVTSTTKELVTGSGFGFEDFSAHELKGVPGTWQVFAVTAVDDRERGRPLPAAEAAERRAAVHPSTGRERPPSKALLGAGLAVLVAIAGIAFVVTRDDSVSPRATGAKSKAPASESVVQIDPEDGTILATVPARGAQPGLPGLTPPTSAHSMVVGQGGVWTLRSFGSLYHIDPQRLEVRTRTELLDPGGLAVSFNIAEGFDAIWVSTGESLIRVNPATDQPEPVLRIPASGTGFSADVAVGGGYVWLGTGDGRLLRLDAATGRHRWVTGLDPIDTIAFGHGAVWTADSFGGTVSRYNTDTMRPEAEIEVAGGIDDLVSGEVAVWALSRSVGSLTKIDVSENVATRIVPVGKDPTGLTAGLGSLWLGDEDGVIRRVDEDTRQVEDIPFGAAIRAIAFDEETDTLWVDVARPR